MAIEIHFEKRINNLAIVREVDPRQRREYLLLTLLAALFVLGLLFYGWQRYRWIDYGYQIEETQKVKERLVEIRQRRLLERASLSSPQRIESIARRDLGMELPQPGQMVTLTPDGPFMIPKDDSPELTARKMEAISDFGMRTSDLNNPYPQSAIRNPKSDE